MKKMDRLDNITAVIRALETSGIEFTCTESGREITFGKRHIKVNHNGVNHWTIRVPNSAKDGIRLNFGTPISIADGLFILGDTLAIKYD